MKFNTNLSCVFSGHCSHLDRQEKGLRYSKYFVLACQGPSFMLDESLFSYSAAFGLVLSYFVWSRKLILFYLGFLFCLLALCTAFISLMVLCRENGFLTILWFWNWNFSHSCYCYNFQNCNCLLSLLVKGCSGI